MEKVGNHWYRGYAEHEQKGREAVFVMRSFVKRLRLNNSCYISSYLENIYGNLVSINSPNNWELTFDQLFISPILSTIDIEVQNYMSHIWKNSKTDENPILRYFV